MRLPRMNDQTKIIVCTAVALVGVDLAVRALMMPRTVHVQTSDVVTAREFKLVDENGNLRAHMYTDQFNEPGLVMYDREGRRRLQLDSFDSIPSLILYNQEGERSTYYGMDFQGRSFLDMYGVGGSSGSLMTTMSASEDQRTPGFSFYGTNGQQFFERQQIIIRR